MLKTLKHSVFLSLSISSVQTHACYSIRPHLTDSRSKIKELRISRQEWRAWMIPNVCVWGLRSHRGQKLMNQALSPRPPSLFSVVRERAMVVVGGKGVTVRRLCENHSQLLSAMLPIRRCPKEIYSSAPSLPLSSLGKNHGNFFPTMEKTWI